MIQKINTNDIEAALLILKEHFVYGEFKDLETFITDVYENHIEYFDSNCSFGFIMICIQKMRSISFQIEKTFSNTRDLEVYSDIEYVFNDGTYVPKNTRVGVLRRHPELNSEYVDLDSGIMFA